MFSPLEIAQLCAPGHLSNADARRLWAGIPSPPIRPVPRYRVKCFYCGSEIPEGERCKGCGAPPGRRRPM